MIYGLTIVMILTAGFLMATASDCLKNHESCKPEKKENETHEN